MLFRFFVERDAVRSIVTATCREEVLDDVGRKGVTACFRLPQSLSDQIAPFVLDHYRRHAFPSYVDLAPDLSIREVLGARIDSIFS